MERRGEGCLGVTRVEQFDSHLKRRSIGWVSGRAGRSARCSVRWMEQEGDRGN